MPGSHCRGFISGAERTHTPLQSHAKYRTDLLNPAANQPQTQEWLMKWNPSVYLANPHSLSPWFGGVCAVPWAPWWAASPWLELHLQQGRLREFWGAFNSICTHQDSCLASPVQPVPQSSRVHMNWDTCPWNIAQSAKNSIKKPLEICSVCWLFILFCQKKDKDLFLIQKSGPSFSSCLLGIPWYCHNGFFLMLFPAEGPQVVLIYLCP